MTLVTTRAVAKIYFYLSLLSVETFGAMSVICTLVA